MNQARLWSRKPPATVQTPPRGFRNRSGAVLNFETFSVPVAIRD
jgi:hypothetical protein